MNNQTLKELLNRRELRKKEKHIKETITKVLDIIDTQPQLLERWEELGAISLRDFILRMEIIPESGDWRHTEEEVLFNNMLHCKNLEEFYTFYNFNEFQYILEPPGFDENKKRQLIKDKLILELINYLNLVTYFKNLCYEHIDSMRKHLQERLLLEREITDIMREWHKEETLNGLSLVLDIIQDEKVTENFAELFTYLDPENATNGNIPVNPETLRDILYRIAQSLEKKEKWLNGKVYQAESDKLKLWKRTSRYNSIIYSYPEKKCYFTDINLNKIFPKSPSEELKFLQLFLREYARYIFNENLGEEINFKEWPDLYMNFLQDDEFRQLLSVLHQEKGEMTPFVAAAEGYLDVFTLYYYNYYRNQRDVFSEWHREKEGYPELMKYIGVVG